MGKLGDTIKGWIAIVAMATISSSFLTKYMEPIKSIPTNPIAIEQKNPIKSVKNIEKKIITLNKSKGEILKIKNKTILFTDLNINNFSSTIFDNQKDTIFKFLNNTQITQNEILPYINNQNILDGKDFRFDVINPRLAKILITLSREENVNPRLILAIYHKESLQGKILLSPTGARGPLQSMPNTILENCSEYRNRFKSENEMIKDLYIQIRAGLREIKKIARGYSIDIGYNSKINKDNIDEIIVILASYNAGYGNFKSNPKYFLLNENETKKYVTSTLSIIYSYDKLIIDKKAGISV